MSEHRVGKRNLQIILVIMALVMAAGAISSIPMLIKELFGKNQAVAVVNDLLITGPEYNRQVRQEEHKIEAYRQQFGESAPEIMRMLGMKTDVRESALEQLINDKLILSIADRLAIELNPLYIAGRLQDPQIVGALFGMGIPSQLYDANNQLDLARFKVFLARQGMTVQQFEASLENTLKEHMVITLAQGAAVVSPADIQQAKLRKFAPKTLTITTVPLATFIKKEEQQALTPELVAAYFAEQNKASRKYMAPEKRTGKVWVFKQKGYDLQAEPGSLVDSFEKRFAADTQAVIHSSLGAEVLNNFVGKKNGSPRALTAQERSDDEKNLINAALFSLTPTTRTAFVDGDTGYIVELTTVDKASALPLEAVKQRVVADIYREKAQQALQKELAQLSPDNSYEKRTVILAPTDDKELEKLRSQGIPMERVANMFLVGQHVEGVAENSGYRVELTAIGKVDESLATARVAAQKNKVLLAELEREAAQRVVYELIASSRENATITMNSSL